MKKQIYINLIIKVLQFLFQKDYSLWLFGIDDGGGSRFSGNTWYLYKYILENNQKIRAVCISQSHSNHRYVNELGGEVVSPNTWSSFVLALKAGVYIVSSEIESEIPNFSCYNTFKVNLWHGIIIKKIYYTSPLMMARRKNRPYKQKIIEFLKGRVKLEKYDFIAATSSTMAFFMTQMFKNDNVYVTGQPRDDIFFMKINKDAILKKYNLFELRAKKIVSYLPTFRDLRKNDEVYYLFEDNWNIQNELINQDIVILQKNHHTSLKNNIVTGNIYYLTDDVDTQDLLYLTEILITDYSSCFGDFLHTLKPIIFYPYDIKEYLINDRELIINYDDESIIPGPKVYDEEELFKAIHNYTINAEYYLDKRKKALEYFQKYSDGKASERAYKTIISELIKKYQ